MERSEIDVAEIPSGEMEIIGDFVIRNKMETWGGKVERDHKDRYSDDYSLCIEMDHHPIAGM